MIDSSIQFWLGRINIAVMVEMVKKDTESWDKGDIDRTGILRGYVVAALKCAKYERCPWDVDCFFEELLWKGWRFEYVHLTGHALQ
jgi:hypothetical protein